MNCCHNDRLDNEVIGNKSFPPYANRECQLLRETALFVDIPTITTLNSYSKRIGIDTKSSVKMSVEGVIIADKIKMPTMACFLYFFNIDTFIIPNFANNQEMTGNSKNSPINRDSVIKVPVYELREIIL